MLCSRFLFFQDVAGYIPSFINASPIHLLVIIATISGTMYISPPVSSSIITTSETERKLIPRYSGYCWGMIVLWLACQSFDQVISIMSELASQIRQSWAKRSSHTWDRMIDKSVPIILFNRHLSFL